METNEGDSSSQTQTLQIGKKGCVVIENTERQRQLESKNAGRMEATHEKDDGRVEKGLSLW